MFVDFDGNDQLSQVQAVEFKKMIEQHIDKNQDLLPADLVAALNVPTPTVELWSMTAPRIVQALVQTPPPPPPPADGAASRPYYMTLLRTIVGTLDYPHLRLVEPASYPTADELHHWSALKPMTIRVATDIVAHVALHRHSVVLATLASDAELTPAAAAALDWAAVPLRAEWLRALKLARWPRGLPNDALAAAVETALKAK